MSGSRKKVLIPNGNLADWALVNAAHRQGMYVITSGLINHAPANQFADEYIQADYSDKDAMLSLAMEKGIDFMVSNANDFGMLSTAYVCEKLGLPGHDSYETAKILHTKSLLKPLAKKLDLHMPVSILFSSREDAVDYIKTQNDLVILKPVDNVGSRGVSVPRETGEIERCVDFAFENSHVGQILIEPFISGFFCAADAMIINKKVHAFVSDANLLYKEGSVKGNEFPQYLRASGAIRPAPFIEEFAPIVIEDFNKIAKELNLVDGCFHCELLLDEDHVPHIYDIHRRMSGFTVPWPVWNLTTGLRWEDYILKAECGMDISDLPAGLIQKRYMHTRNIYAPRDGIIKKVEFDEYLTSHIYPGYDGKRYALHNICVLNHKHVPVVNKMPPNGTGLLYFEFDTHEEACYLGSADEDHFYQHITFEYDE